jgi:hypothetical protein
VLRCRFYHVMPAHCHWRHLRILLYSPEFFANVQSFHMATQFKTILSMLSTTLRSGANDHTIASVERNWSFPPALTTSEIHKNRFEEPLVSQISPASAQLQVNQVEEPQYSTPSSPNAIMTTRRRSLHISQPFPRSFEELQPERWYLLDCLQIENRKATELLWSSTLLEERLAENNKSCFQRGKLKKRLGWLRGRLDETHHQEKRILTRLGQVTWEIQTRERWAQIEIERQQYEYELYQQYYHGFQGRQQTPLNPASPEFQPQGYHVCRKLWPPVTCQQWECCDDQEGLKANYGPAAEKTSSNSSDLAAQWSPSQEVAPDDLETTPGPSLHHEIGRGSLMHRSSSLNDTAEQLEALLTNTTTSLVPRVRRFSLPSLPVLLIQELNAWTLTPEGKDIRGLFKEEDQVEHSWARKA